MAVTENNSEWVGSGETEAEIMGEVLSLSVIVVEAQDEAVVVALDEAVEEGSVLVAEGDELPVLQKVGKEVREVEELGVEDAVILPQLLRETRGVALSLADKEGLPDTLTQVEALVKAVLEGLPLPPPLPLPLPLVVMDSDMLEVPEPQ